MIRAPYRSIARRLLWIAAGLTAIGAAAPLHADEEHQPRHGGYFGDADDLYHYELLRENGGVLILYVNDEENAPLDTKKLRSRWIANGGSLQTKQGEFLPEADGSRFVATIPDATDAQPLDVIVAVEKEGVWAEMEFSLPPVS
ncbi:MAG: hypothetical protein NC910_01880 [Candidatus Omnitrophica bacterium]|nr:hypothetical protein [Candidatus Omnitrophota bacterium]